MHTLVIDENKRDDSARTRLFARRFHLWVDLPENPVCWFLGHRAKVTVIDPPSSLKPYRRLECRVCGRRYEQPPLGPRTVDVDWQEIQERQVEAARRDPAGVERSCERRMHWHKRTAEFGASLYVGGRQVYDLGVSLGVGGRGSETPIDVALYLPFASLYLQTNLGARFAERLTRGNGSREAELLLGRSSERGPVSEPFLHLAPWARKNESRRADPWWAKNHRIRLNPLDHLWGTARYSYEDALGPIETLVFMPEGDEHRVELTLRRQTFGRPRGGPQSTSWSVNWTSHKGIPFRSHSWKGDGVHGSGVEVTHGAVESGRWPLDASAAIAASVSRMRSREGWTLPGTAPVPVAAP